MMKWMPFNALLEQGDHIGDMLRGREKIEMPILSDDQHQELNYQLEEAYLLQKEITLTYFENHKYKQVTGYITTIDIQNKLLFIGSVSITACQIIRIED